MSKKIIHLLLAVIMLLGMIMPMATVAAASEPPLVSEPVYSVGTGASERVISETELKNTTGHINVAVNIKSPAGTGAAQVKLIVAAVNSSTGKMDTPSVVSQNVNASTPSVDLKTGVNVASGYELRYFVQDENGASLINNAPLMVRGINARPTIKYVQLSWNAAQDDFSAIKEYIITRDGVEIGRTTEPGYIDIAESDREGVTLTYGITAIDHGGLKSEEATITITTPEYIYVKLYPTQKETVENSKNMDFFFIDSAKAENSTINQATTGGMLADADGKVLPYRETIMYLSGATNANSIMYFYVHPEAFDDTDHNVTMQITYLDKGTHSLNLHYFRPNKSRNGVNVEHTNTGKWLTKTLEFEDFTLSGAEGNNYPNGSQFRWQPNTTAATIVLSEVRLINTAKIGDDLKDLPDLPPVEVPDDPANPDTPEIDPIKKIYVKFGEDEASTTSENMKFHFEEFNADKPNTQQSVGLTYQGEPCRSTVTYNNGSDYTYMYFNVNTNVITETDNNIIMSITYYDDGSTPFKCTYFTPEDDSSGNNKRNSFTISGSGKAGWRTVTKELTDFSATNVDSGWVKMGQFRFNSEVRNKELYISELRIEKPGPDNRVQFFMLGDSIMADYNATYYPQAGIGQMLPEYFDSEYIKVRNLGIGSRSSKSFYNENYFQNVYEEVKAGDYVFIKFGHNDDYSGENKEEKFTDPTQPETTEGSYKWYLKQYVDMARAKDAKPILLTPTPLREFNGDSWSESAQSGHLAYVKAMREFANNNNVILIDTSAYLQGLLENGTEEESRKYYLYLDHAAMSADPLFISGKKYTLVSDSEYDALDATAKQTAISPSHPFNDKAHLNEYGAHTIAKYIAKQMAALGLSVKDYVINTEDDVPEDNVPEITYPESTDNKINLFMCGDSIMTGYASGYYPQKGIGQVIGRYLNPENITIKNLAQGGLSSKSFWDANLLQNVSDQIEKGDYIFIKFGHNDMHSEEYRHTDPTQPETTEGSYKWYLKKYVDLAKEKEAIPVLLTSIAEREYEGSVWSESKQRHTAYINAMREFAEANNITLIDTNEFTKSQLMDMTEEASREYYLYLDHAKMSADPDFPKGDGARYTLVSDSEYDNLDEAAQKMAISPSNPYNDKVHINDKGANWIAKYIIEQIEALNMPLKAYIREPAEKPEFTPTGEIYVNFGENEETTVSENMEFYFEEFNESNPKTQQSLGTVYEGEPCRVAPSYADGTKICYLYFKIDTAKIGENDNNVTFALEYYDDGATSIRVDYFTKDKKADGSNQKNNFEITTSGTAGWRTVTKTINDFSTVNVDSGWITMGQFRIFSLDTSKNLYLSSIKVAKTGEEVTPTAEPTVAPTAEPTPAPSAEPTVAPTAEPTPAPSAEPTVAPTAEPTPAPSAEPTVAPTAEPTVAPTAEPTVAPTSEPTTTPEADENTVYVNFGADMASTTSKNMTFYAEEFNSDNPKSHQTQGLVYEGIPCRFGPSYADGTQRAYMYFMVDDTVITGTDNEVTFTIDYYDDGKGEIRVDYFLKDKKSDGSNQKSKFVIATSGTVGWRTVTKTISDFSTVNVDSDWLTKGQFRLFALDVDGKTNDLYVSSIKIEKAVQETESPDATETPDTYNGVSLFIAGDSIAQERVEADYPASGWAQHLSRFFSSDLRIVNMAIGGMSSRTYYENTFEDYGQTPWAELLSQAKEGDYVVFQFAHNDTNSSANRDTDPSLGIDVAPNPSTKTYSYKWYLKQFITEARAKGLNPILASSVSKHIVLGDYTPRPFGAYADAMVEVGEALDVPVLNINEETAKLYEEYGRVNDKVFFRILEEGAFSKYPNGTTDHQHLRDYGGIYVAYLFRTELLKTDSALKEMVLDTYPNAGQVFVGDRFHEDIKAEKDGDKILLPAAAVLKALGSEDSLESENGFTATIFEKTVAATVGSTEYQVNGSPVNAAYAPVKVGDTIYVNSAFFEEICGMNVYYNEFMDMTTVLTGIETTPKIIEETFTDYVGSATTSVVPKNWNANYFVENKSYMIGEEVEGSTGTAAKIVRANAVDDSGAELTQYFLQYPLQFIDSREITMRVKTSNTTDQRDIWLQVKEAGKGSPTATTVSVARLKDGYITGPNAKDANKQELTTEWTTLRFKVHIVNDANVDPKTYLWTYVVKEDGTEVLIDSFDVPYSTGMLELMRVTVHGTDGYFYIDDITITTLDNIPEAEPGNPIEPPATDTPNTPTNDVSQGGWVKLGATASATTANCMNFYYEEFNADAPEHEQTIGTSYEGRECRQTTNYNDGANPTYMYFSVADSLLSATDNEIKLSIDYYDDGVTPFKMTYFTPNDNALGVNIRNTVKIETSGTKGWRTFTTDLTDFSNTNVDSNWITFGQFRIGSDVSSDYFKVPLYISEIRIEKKAAEPIAKVASIVFGKDEASSVLTNMEFDFTEFVATAPEANHSNGTTYEGRDCRVARVYNEGAGRCYMYFTVDTSVLTDAENNVKFTFDYYDDGVNTIRLDYFENTSDGTTARANFTIPTSGTKGWRTATKTVNNFSSVDIESGWKSLGQMRLFSLDQNYEMYVSGVKIEAVEDKE